MVENAMMAVLATSAAFAGLYRERLLDKRKRVINGMVQQLCSQYPVL